MKRFVVMFLTGAMLALTGCSAFDSKPQQPKLTVYAHANLAEQVRVTALYPQERGRAAGAQVQVVDDIGRIRLESELNEKGQLRFRYPQRAVYVDVRVTAADGLVGEKRVELFERDGSCIRIPGC